VLKLSLITSGKMTRLFRIIPLFLPDPVKNNLQIWICKSATGKHEKLEVQGFSEMHF
jgi:hypothetical protein